MLLDIGAHVGETLSVAMSPQWRFDRIWSFEPAAECWDRLREVAGDDDRVVIEPFGLWTEDATMPLYGAGAIGASLFASKDGWSDAPMVELRDAARWFRENLSSGDTVVAKINCEGAECDLLDRLVESGEIDKIDELVVHFDVRKVPELRHRERQTRRHLAGRVAYHSADQVMIGRTTEEKTANWLAWRETAGLRRWRHTVLRRAEFVARIAVYRVRLRLARRA